MIKKRIETDLLGPKKIKANRLWGAQTQRSLENFKIGKEIMPIEIKVLLLFLIIVIIYFELKNRKDKK